MHAESVETLELFSLGGNDTVFTSFLPNTQQVFRDEADGALDVLNVDAEGLCPFVTGTIGDILEVAGRAPIKFTEFTNVNTPNALCGGIVDVSAGVLRYDASAG